MPELAEVEYFRKRWDAGLGKRIVAVQLHGEKRIFRETEARAIEHQLVRQKLLRSGREGQADALRPVRRELARDSPWNERKIAGRGRNF